MIEPVPMQLSVFSNFFYDERPRDVGRREERRYALPVGLLLYGATGASSNSVAWPLELLAATNVGLSDSFFRVKPPSAQMALQEIKSTTGLTWQQLARFFNVRPRSLHLWMDGKALDSIHRERLYRVLAIIRKLPFSEAFKNRTLLLSPQADGKILLDLLASGDDDAFVARVAGTPPDANVGKMPSADTQRPLLPSILMDAAQDTLHVSQTRRRAVKAAKRKGSVG